MNMTKNMNENIDIQIIISTYLNLNINEIINKREKINTSIKKLWI